MEDAKFVDFIKQISMYYIQEFFLKQNLMKRLEATFLAPIWHFVLGIVLWIKS